MARNVIDVSVNRRVLWIGGDAYPLQQIARARQLTWWPPKRSRTIIRFVRQLAGLLIAASLLAALMENSSDKAVAAVPSALLLAGFAFCLYRLITRLRQKPLYQLVIETSSSSATAVVSHDRYRIDSLIQMIMEAINNPHAEFTLQVETVHIGDRINQFGDHNIGKRVGQ